MLRDHGGRWAARTLLAAGGYLLYRELARRVADRRQAQSQHPPDRHGAGVSAGIYDHAAQAAKEERNPAGTLITDMVDEASDDSFPCSDPPSWTARG